MKYSLKKFFLWLKELFADSADELDLFWRRQEKEVYDQKINSLNQIQMNGGEIDSAEKYDLIVKMKATTRSCDVITERIDAREARHAVRHQETAS